jgi:hypothetical protein
MENPYSLVTHRVMIGTTRRCVRGPTKWTVCKDGKPFLTNAGKEHLTRRQARAIVVLLNDLASPVGI